ncbi:dienelactone hydrolase family protein [Xylaria bambusicola]|uniref:dienelactone hydrolase family protein n=1 Tax=Xylaria bambusicola TaxID=326684 RepID=UPI0020075492|nr:dienelactone hydrolase family protein [Xylaria bambusicola]KAI0505215.1 dienelactone hydrolase family protein [Xylaria bambusicola]
MSCPACFSGAVHEGTPTGTVTKLHGLDVYVAEPASGNKPKGIIVLIPDMFGWDFVNIRLMADHFAKKRDYRVYLPDFMDGHGAPVSMIDSMQVLLAPKTWYDTFSKPFHALTVARHGVPAMFFNRPGKTFPVVKSFMESLRRNEAAHLPVGVTGYCWGGKHVVLLAEGFSIDGKPLVDAGFTAHPSLLTIPDEIEKITVPVSFALGDKDFMVNTEQAMQLESIVLEKPDGQKGECRMYPGYGHGFACRVDVSNEDPKAADEAEDQALAWFEKHFDDVKY